MGCWGVVICCQSLFVCCLIIYQLLVLGLCLTIGTGQLLIDDISITILTWPPIITLLIIIAQWWLFSSKLEEAKNSGKSSVGGNSNANNNNNNNEGEIVDVDEYLCSSVCTQYHICRCFFCGDARWCFSFIGCFPCCTKHNCHFDKNNRMLCRDSRINVLIITVILCSFDFVLLYDVQYELYTETCVGNLESNDTNSSYTLNDNSNIMDIYSTLSSNDTYLENNCTSVTDYNFNKTLDNDTYLYNVTYVSYDYMAGSTGALIGLIGTYFAVFVLCLYLILLQLNLHYTQRQNRAHESNYNYKSTQNRISINASKDTPVGLINNDETIAINNDNSNETRSNSIYYTQYSTFCILFTVKIFIMIALLVLGLFLIAVVIGGIWAILSLSFGIKFGSDPLPTDVAIIFAIFTPIEGIIFYFLCRAFGFFYFVVSKLLYLEANNNDDENDNSNYNNYNSNNQAGDENQDNIMVMDKEERDLNCKNIAIDDESSRLHLLAENGDENSVESSNNENKMEKIKTFGKNVAAQASSHQKEFESMLLGRFNVKFETFVIGANALVTTVITLIMLFMSQITGKDNDKCVEYSPFHINDSCSVKIVSISVGSGILFIISFGFCIDKYLKPKSEGQNNSTSFYMIWSLKDAQFRGIILLKFGFFLIKPALIASLNEMSEDDSSAFDTISSVTFQILMLVTVIILAYATFDKNYRLLGGISSFNKNNDSSSNKINKLKINGQLLSKSYLITYVLSMIAMHTIYILVIVFAWRKKQMNNYEWQRIIYPQCFWLLCIQVYHNEISHIINILKHIFGDKDDQNGSNKNDTTENVIGDDKEISMNKLTLKQLELQSLFHIRVKRLFVMQVYVWLSSMIAIIFYTHYAVNCDYSSFQWQDFIWCWQALLPVCVVVAVSVGIYSNFN